MISTFILLFICTILTLEVIFLNYYYENHDEIRKNKLCPFKLIRASLNGTVRYHWHKNIEILLITEGDGFIQYATDIFPLAQNDMVIANSNVIHRLYSQTGINFCCLIIDDLFCSENGLNIENICFEKIIAEEQARRLLENVIVCSEVYEEKKTALSIAAFRSAVLTMLVYLCEHYSQPVEEGNTKEPSSEKHVKRVMKYLNENFTRPINLEALASLCGVTKFHLMRQFKQYTGQTIFTYLNHLRCQNAELLIAGGTSITEAAYASGFESLSYFSRTYKKNMGTSPSKKI